MTDTTVRFLVDGTEHTGTLKAKKGLFWQVETEPGILKNIPVKAIIQDQEPDPAPAAPAPRMGPSNTNTLAGQLAGIQKAAEEQKTRPERKKAEKKAVDPDLITLAALCQEAKILGRIARRRLRKEFGTLEEGARWEWNKDDPVLVKIRAILAAKEDPVPAADTGEAQDSEADDGQTDEARAGLAEENLVAESEED